MALARLSAACFAFLQHRLRYGVHPVRDICPKHPEARQKHPPLFRLPWSSWSLVGWPSLTLFQRCEAINDIERVVAM